LSAGVALCAVTSMAHPYTDVTTNMCLERLSSARIVHPVGSVSIRLFLVMSYQSITDLLDDASFGMLCRYSRGPVREPLRESGQGH
jgi:hypothetical protein